MSTDTQNNIGLLKRLGSVLYDLLLLLAILLIASLPWAVSGIQQGQAGYIVYKIFIYALIPSYYIGFWVYGGQTLGMKTWKIRVVNLNGHAIGWSEALMRLVYVVLSTAVFGLGFIYALFDKQSRTWHDILSKTQLISVSSSANKSPTTKKE